MKPEFWKDRSVLVTGSSGFVGSWLVRKLEEMGAKVARFDVADRSGSITDYGSVYEAVEGVRTVFHLAAQSQVGKANEDPDLTFYTNVDGTCNILEACRRLGWVKQICIASSDKSYGESPILPYTENTPLRGLYPYDCSKACADIISQCYAKTYSLPIAIARMGNIYGGGDLNWNRIVPGTIRSVLQGQSPVIRSDGTPIRDYFYVEDAVNAYIALAEGLAFGMVQNGEAFNFSNDEPMSTRTMAEYVASTTLNLCCALPKDLTLDIRNEATNEIQAQHLSSQKARAKLGWVPNWTLADGLKETVSWYRKYFEENKT
jgi:CDP-glucose 4,6-dehydratase